MGLPEHLPVLEGWRHRWETFLPGEIRPINPGDSFDLLKERECGWGWCVVLGSRTHGFFELTIAVDDFTPRHNMLVASPFTCIANGFVMPDDHIWCDGVAYAAGNFVLSYTPANFRPYKKLVWISVKNPTVSPLGVPIVAPLVIDAALVVRIQIHDKEAYVNSVRKLNTPLISIPALPTLPTP